MFNVSQEVLYESFSFVHATQEVQYDFGVHDFQTMRCTWNNESFSVVAIFFTVLHLAISELQIMRLPLFLIMQLANCI